MKRIRKKFDVPLCGFDVNMRMILESEIDEILSFRPPIPILRADLDTFVRRIQLEYDNNEFLDTQLATSIVGASRDLLSYLEGNPGAEATPFILAAIRYLIRPSDGRDDFSSLDGFEDDRRVLAAVLEKFDLQSICKI